MTICGANCMECGMKDNCKGCNATCGSPLGGKCIVAECYKKGGEAKYLEYKKQLIDEFNALDIKDLSKINELYHLCGAYINMEYELKNGTKVKLLNDKDIYFGNQVEKPDGENCYGLAADDTHLLVCEYGCNGVNPQIVVYKKR